MNTPIDPFSALMAITARPALVMARGDGSYLWDETGKRYLDLIQGWAVNCLGHAPAVLQRALARQAQALWNPSPAFHNRPQLRLAQRLVAGCELDQVFFCNSGAEANEGAVKLARKWGATIGRRGGKARSQVLTTVGSFHGRTLAMMAASGKPAFQGLFPPAVPGFRHVAFNSLDAIKSAISDDTVAVMVEPIQGEAGVVVPSPSYLIELRSLCDAHDLLLICDEVQTGIGRTGPLFAHLDAGVVPDLMTLGKGLGGGAPLAALLCRGAISCFEPGDQGGTFNGNPLMTAVGEAVLQTVCEPEFVAQAAAASEALSRGLHDLARRHGHGEVRGRGMLQALQLETANAHLVRDRALERGLLINACQPDVLRFMPALNLSLSELEEALCILDDALTLKTA